MVPVMAEDRRASQAIAPVTVAVATCARPAALARCLDALLSGEVLPREILVVDQGDNGEGRAVVERLAAPSVSLRYVRDTRRGLSASRNAAIACASQPFVAVTDDDCVPGPSWVAAIERGFAAPEAPDAVSGRVLPLGPDAPGLYAAATRSSERRTVFTGRVEPWFVGTGGNFAFRRELIGRVGPYDERLGAGSPGRAAEDLDLFYRITTAGARVLYDPQSVIYHERKTWPRLLETNEGYGRGIGAFCAIWARRAHLFAVYILVLWLGHHVKRLAASAAHRDWRIARDALVTLRGTAGGVRYGLGLEEQR
jgi:GT2 family glycosyltransferase